MQLMQPCFGCDIFAGKSLWVRAWVTRESKTGSQTHHGFPSDPEPPLSPPDLVARPRLLARILPISPHFLARLRGRAVVLIKACEHATEFDRVDLSR